LFLLVEDNKIPAGLQPGSGPFLERATMALIALASKSLYLSIFAPLSVPLILTPDHFWPFYILPILEILVSYGTFVQSVRNSSKKWTKFSF